MKTKDKIKVSKIEITIGNKTISLTAAELRELKDVLEQLFPEQKTVYIPSAPIIIERGREPWPIVPRWPTNPIYPYWTATCSGETLMLDASTKVTA